MQLLEATGWWSGAWYCSLLLFSAACAVRASDWPQYRGPNSAGVSAETVVTAPAALWNTVVGTGYSSVIISGGRVYAMGHVETGGGRGTDTLYCLDADSGSVLWTYSYNCRSTQGNFGGPSSQLPADPETAGPRATPAADGAYVYTLSIDGHLFCLDAVTGQVVWYRNVVAHLGGASKVYGFCASPVVSGNRLLLDIGGTLAALETTSGAVLWKQSGGGGWVAASTPVLAGASVVFGSRYLLGVDVATGLALWQYDMGREAMATHIVAGNQVFFATYPDNGKVSRITASGGSAGMDWQDTAVQTYHLTNVLVGGYLYVMDNSGTEWSGHDSGDGYADSDADANDSSLKCLEFASGALKWTGPSLGWATVVAAGNELLVLRETGHLLHVQATPTAYTEIADYPGVIGQWCWTSPALADGRLYCRNDKGALVCLSIAPAVTIMAADAMALETSDSGRFTVKRVAADISADLTVDIAISGTAEAGDYNLAGGSITATTVTIPGGSASVDVTVTPLADGDSDTETVVITLQPGSGYVVGPQAGATVYILDATTAPPAVTVTAENGWVLEGGPGSDRFVVTRSAADAWPLVVDIAIGGTALPADYLLDGSDGVQVVIAASQATAAVTLRAPDDATADGDRTVTMSIVANPTYYSLGAPASATITIVDDDDAEEDSDGDGMDDGWELCYWGNLAEGASSDYDADGLVNGAEYTAGTDPTVQDTDKDGSSDGDEVAAGADPLNPTSFTSASRAGGKGAWCAAGAGDATSLALVLALMVLAWSAGRLLSRRYS